MNFYAKLRETVSLCVYGKNHIQGMDKSDSVAKEGVSNNQLEEQPKEKLVNKAVASPTNAYPVIFDIEVTNDCNTCCIFCPRDKIKEKGYLSFHDFIKAVERFNESNHYNMISLCGLGEPLLHTNIVDFVKYLSDNNIPPHLTTNGKLLNEDIAQKLLEAGLKSIVISASGIEQTYEKIHRIKFDLIKKNVTKFVELAKNDCETMISLVSCRANNAEVSEIERFYRNIGASRVLKFKECNRGGSLDIGYCFTRSNRFFKEAREILIENKIHHLCVTPFISLFVGWNGYYYLCCHDFSKKEPLGHVNDFSISEIHQKIKKELPGYSVCSQCDQNPINIIREILFKIEAGEMTQADLDNKLAEMKKKQSGK